MWMRVDVFKYLVFTITLDTHVGEIVKKGNRVRNQVCRLFGRAYEMNNAILFKFGEE